MIKSELKALFAAAILLSATAFATEDAKTSQKPETKSELTQSQRALDHGPHAQVTPAVKRKRLESTKAESSTDQSK